MLPRFHRERALRIVSYATQPLGGLPALLARCISARTGHTAHCLWSGPPLGAPPDPSAIDWTANPAAAADALAAADVVLLHDGQVAPQHRALLADKVVITLAHHPQARRSPWVQLGFPGAVLCPQLAELPAFQTWPQLPLPLPWWEPLFQLAAPTARPAISFLPLTPLRSATPAGDESPARVLARLAAHAEADLSIGPPALLGGWARLVGQPGGHVVVEGCAGPSYHYGSLVGLATGGVVVNGLEQDSVAAAGLRRWAAEPPFVSAQAATLAGTLERLYAQGQAALAAAGQANRAWIERHWDFAQHWERFWMPLITQALPPPEPRGKVVHRPLSMPQQVPNGRVGKSMKMTAYPLYDQAATLQAAPEERAWSMENEAASAGLAFDTVNGKGWELLCPYGFEATWNGGPNAEDIEIRLETTDADRPDFVQSQGGGILTFHSGYQIKTEDTQALWVRGPINTPREGLYPLEHIVDTALLPCTIMVNWMFTRPNQTVRFEAGQPFAGLLPYPKNGVESFEAEVISPAGDETDDEAAYEQMLQQMAQEVAVQSIFRRLQAGDEPPAAPAVESAATAVPTVDLAATNGHWAAQLTDPPPVSCICPTYGRVELLEEAICSFLQQDYPGRKELIVLNDYAGQTLEFEHPEVRIINVPTRFRSVGEKYKAAVGFCSHELIFVWHDDDIYLPHRLSFSVTHLVEKRGFFKADRAWFWNEGHLTGPDRNTFHGGSCFSRELFLATQGYPHISNSYDAGFEELCEDERTGVTVGYRVQPQDIYYIYRWNGTGSYHLSLCAQDGHGRDQVAAYVQQHAAQGQIKQGRIKLDPHWKTDYTALIQSHLNNGHTKHAADEIPFPPPFFAIPAPEPMPEEAAAALFRGTHPARISVILPALNESVLLQRTVEQFEATLPANSEIIVVDNGSNDGSADFLVGQGRPGVTLIQSPKPLGVAGARNCGLAAARGEVVVFADAHIDVPERWWQPIVATLNRPNVGVVGPGIGVMGKPEHPPAYGQRIAERNLRVEWLHLEGREPHPVPTLGGGFMAMRHETLQQAGAFDEGMPQWGSEDLELCVRYWLLGYEVWVVPEVTVLHYFRSVNPLKVKQGIVTHNLLRVALLHFTQARIARVVGELQKAADFGQALAHSVESDVWQRRAALASRRTRDDDWLFEKFADSCLV